MDEKESLARARARCGEVIGGNYVLGDMLGIGGMGVVHVAVQRSLDRTVAVKLPRPELAHDGHVRRRFRNEALAGSRINHRNIVRVLDFGDQHGMPYLVMEHVAGPRLGQLLEEVGSLPYMAALVLVRQIVAGLEDAHADGIVHADLKCDNVLVETLRDGTAVPRVIDFGIARFIDERPERPERFVTGTPEYVAPEVVRGELPTFAADVYAVGVMLYELVTGTTPFGGGSSAAIMRRKLETEAMPMSACCPDLAIPKAVDELVTQLLARDPRSRLPDARALARCLDALSDSGPTSTLPLAVSTCSIFSTDATTANMDLGITIEPVTAEHSFVPELRRRLATAVAGGSADAIAHAYLELARGLADDRQYDAARIELEEGVQRLTRADGSGPVWRLLLALAMHHERHGHATSARLAARAAQEEATKAGSPEGRSRAEQLCARLWQRARAERRLLS